MTESLSIALTVAVVERIVRREETLRKAPRVNRALMHINAEFARFVDAVALDYVATHVEHPRPIPRDRIALLDQWLEDQDRADRPHVPLPPDDETLREQGQEFARQVDQYDHRDRDVLEPELVAAIRDVWSSRQNSIEWERRIGHTVAPLELVDPEALSYRTLVAGARALGEVLRKHAPPILFEIDEDTLQWVASFGSEQL